MSQKRAKYPEDPELFVVAQADNRPQFSSNQRRHVILRQLHPMAGVTPFMTPGAVLRLGLHPVKEEDELAGKAGTDDETPDKVAWRTVSLPNGRLSVDPEVWRALNDLEHELATEWMRFPAGSETLNHALEEWAGHRQLKALDIQEGDEVQPVAEELHVLEKSHTRMQDWLKANIAEVEEKRAKHKENGVAEKSLVWQSLTARLDTLLEVQSFFA